MTTKRMLFSCPLDVVYIYQPGESGELDSAQLLFDRHLVELSAVTSSGQDIIGNEMRAFADQLKPYAIYSCNFLVP